MVLSLSSALTNHVTLTLLSLGFLCYCCEKKRDIYEIKKKSTKQCDGKLLRLDMVLTLHWHPFSVSGITFFSLDKYANANRGNFITNDRMIRRLVFGFISLSHTIVTKQ